jgi:hypothetical protein
MRSPSEPESSNSREHLLLDLVESDSTTMDAIGARMEVLKESERNMRGGHFPELYPRRLRNMQLLFDLLRSQRSTGDGFLWLESRLLRLMEKHDQCRQLCQAVPMYRWSFPALQEFVWASRGDSFPYDRHANFQHEDEAALAGQLYEAAKTMHESKCYQWQQAHDATAKPNEREQAVSWRNGFIVFAVLIVAVIGWYFYGWMAGLMAFVGGGLLLNFAGDDDEMIKERMAQWRRDNPRPVMHLTRAPGQSGPVGGGFPDIG